MAETVLADTSFLVAFLSENDKHHRWAVEQAKERRTCESVLAETALILGGQNLILLVGLLRRYALAVALDFAQQREPVLRLMEKYADVPMSLADTCLIRLTELSANPIVLTADEDFRIYRWHSRQVVPCAMP